jgi:glucose-6-phosphate-specific signal transduction histidine kinase
MAELTELADGHAEAWGEDAVNALAEIESRSRATLDEMRSVVGALRQDGVEAPLAPQPTLTELEALLLRAKGSDAQLSVEGNPRVLPAAVELSAYRIVEQLLDALADSPDIEVRIRFADAALELEVSGPASRRADQALERARERVALHAGSLRTTVRHGRTQAVVSLPLLAPV